MMNNTSDYRMFRNFVRCEFEIEVIRAVKFQELLHAASPDIEEVEATELLPQARRELRELKDNLLPTFIVDTIMSKIEDSSEEEAALSEEHIYLSILNKLQTNAKWDDDETDQYLSTSKEIWPQ